MTCVRKKTFSIQTCYNLLPKRLKKWEKQNQYFKQTSCFPPKFREYPWNGNEEFTWHRMSFSAWLIVSGCNQGLEQDRPVCADTPYSWRSSCESERAARRDVVDVVDMLTVRVGQSLIICLNSHLCPPSVSICFSAVHLLSEVSASFMFFFSLWCVSFLWPFSLVFDYNLNFVCSSLTGRVTMPRRQICTRCKF